VHRLSDVKYCHLWSVRFTICFRFIVYIKRMHVRIININFVFIFSWKMFLKLLIRSRIQLDMNNKVHRSSCNALMILFRFQWQLNFVDRFSKTRPISNVTNICRKGHKLCSVGIPTERRKDTMKLTVDFNNFWTNLKWAQNLQNT